MKKPEKTIPTLLGLLLVIGGVGATVVLVGGPLRLWTSADEEVKPQEIRVTNMTDEGFTVSWTTYVSVSGWVQYKEDSLTARNLVASDERDEHSGEFGSYLTHLVTLRDLKAETDYRVRVGTGRTLGPEFVVRTLKKLRALPRAEIVYGQVMTAGGDPAAGAIVYAAMPGTNIMSALVKPSGSWVIPIALTRTRDGKSYIKYSQQAPLSILVQGGTLGSAELATQIGAANPVPPIKLALPTPTLTPTSSPGNQVPTQ